MQSKSNSRLEQIKSELKRLSNQVDRIQSQLYQPIDTPHTVGNNPTSSQIGLNRVDFPFIPPVIASIQRPFWSVMIPTYNGKKYLKETLESVLVQAPNVDQMQIEVIDDCSTEGDIETLVKEVGKGRVTFHRNYENLGLVGNWNACIQRSIGYFVHILHQDDIILPEFYSKLQSYLEKDLEVGAAFCRHRYIDNDGKEIMVSDPERETPGILDHWIERIGIMQRIQFPSIVIKREVYEKIGGFCPQAGYAADWEMWRRIAVNYPFWYEPTVLACWRKHSGSESSKQVRLGMDIAELHQSIEISKSYLPKEIAAVVSDKARDHYALYALDNAQRFLSLREYDTAIAQLQEGIKCAYSVDIKQQLANLLSSIKKFEYKPLEISTRNHGLDPAQKERKELAEIWLNLPNEHLKEYYYGGLGKKHKEIMSSGIKEQLITDKEINDFASRLFANVARGMQEPRAIHYLLAAMLYFYPHQLPIPYQELDITGWLFRDYVEFLLSSPRSFWQAGEVDHHYRYKRELISYIYDQIFFQTNHQKYQRWLDVAEVIYSKWSMLSLYFSKDNLSQEIATKYGDIIEFLLKKEGHKIDYSFKPKTQQRQKIRLGVLNRYFSLNSTEIITTVPFFEHLNKDEFEIILYSSEWTDNSLVEQYCRNCADRLTKLPSDLKDQAETIRRDDLDILFIGSNITCGGKLALLSTHKLARLQGVAFACPVTTGIRNMDYYILGQYMAQIPNIQAQFREKIIPIIGSGDCFYYPSEGITVRREQNLSKIKIDRKSWGADEKTTVFISGANFYKIIPEMMDAWARILAEVSDSLLVLYPCGPAWDVQYPMATFMKLMSDTFAKYGVSESRLIIFTVSLNIIEINQCLQLADIYLDSFPHSGCTSLIDPWKVGLPTIIMQGNTLRGNHGDAMLRELGIPDLIAENEQLYINLAIDLAKNNTLREHFRYLINQKMQNQPPFLNTRLFSAKVGSALAEFLHNWNNRSAYYLDDPTAKVSRSNFGNFTYSKESHFAKFKRFGWTVNTELETCDLKVYQDLLVYNFIIQNLPPGSKLLEIGGGESRLIEALKDNYECWNLDKFEGVGNGPVSPYEAKDHRIVLDYIGNFNQELQDNYFDFVFSISTLEHIWPENDENFKNICDDIDRVLKPGGLCLHCIDIVLRSTDMWTNGILPYMINNIKMLHPITPFAEIPLEPDTFFMSETAYERSWQGAINKTYEDFGKPLSYNVLYEKQKVTLSLPYTRYQLSSYDNQSNFVESSSQVKVSAIISTYNSEKFIDGCLQSLVIQTLYKKGELEIIVINSGSKQNEEVTINNFQSKYPNIKYIQTERETLYKAWNRGIQQSLGKYVINANTDDRFSQDALERMLMEMESHPEISAVYGQWMVTQTENDNFDSNTKKFVFNYPEFFPPLFFYYQITSHAALIRRNVFDSIGYYDDTFKVFGDREFMLRFASAGLIAKLIPHLVGLYYENPESLSLGNTGKDVGGKEFSLLREQYLVPSNLVKLFGKIPSDIETNLASLYTTVGSLGKDFYIWGDQPVSDLDFAEKTLHMALEIDHTNLIALNNLAILHCGRGEYLKAEGMFEKALQKNYSEFTKEVKRNLVICQGVSNHINDYAWTKPSYTSSYSWSQVIQVEKVAEQPLVSIIIPTKDRPQMLKIAVQSVLDQTYKNIEIIVVNDGGVDVQELLNRLNYRGNIFYLKHDYPKERSATRNAGIRIAKGKYIGYLDDDDLYYPNHIQTLVEFLENSEHKVAYTDATKVDQEKQDGKYVTVNRSVPYSYDFDQNLIMERNYIPILCIMHERGCLEQTGLFDETLDTHEDWDLWIRMYLKFGSFYHIKQTTCEFTWRTDGSTTSSRRRDDFERTREIVRNRYSSYINVSSVVQLIAKQPLVSVIVPTKDRPEMLAQAIQSVLNQTFTELEIIVVNDGGVDVQSVISRLNTKGNIVYKKHDHTLERSVARNTGIRTARGKYIAYLDDDDNYYPNHIETLVKFLENSEYKIAYTDAVMAQQEKQNGEYVTINRSVPHSLDFDKEKILVSNCTPNLCLMHEKSCLDEVGLFDETLSTHEDWDLIIRLSRKFDIAHIKETTCEFTQRNDGTNTSSHNRADFTRTREIIFNKYRQYAEANSAILDAQKEAFIAEAKELAQQVQHLQSQVVQKESELQQNQAEKSQLSVQVESWQRTTQEVQAKLEATQSEKEWVKSQLNSWKQTAEEMQLELDRSRLKLKQAQSQLEQSTLNLIK
ncbi:glycosyltransferase [Planktothrix agardhii]|uniref:glycosyltransferase n=1 Tax=Planktothrix agardhii TaxID=1160 RepID=UPI001D0A6BF9|nr:glycosyltransferase [Planktothrix agardhii]MCB8785459.1 glycosyltransferase [Planktothrix agardhii 1025]MCF3612821.1 glycosyltransferase [Planktothrix agardhii 1027]CAD5942496.1 putative glycosyltransferase RBE_0706 [Planktothrix agardhii]